MASALLRSSPTKFAERSSGPHRTPYARIARFRITGVCLSFLTMEYSPAHNIYSSYVAGEEDGEFFAC